jgi:hypothetical protein
MATKRRTRPGLGVTVNVGSAGGKSEAKPARTEGVDPRPAMNRAWEQVATMTPAAAVAAVWTVKGIESIDIAKLVPGMANGVPVGKLFPGEPNPEDVESFILQRWGAAVYNFSPIYRGLKIRTRSFPIGGEAALAASNALPGAPMQDELAQVDKVIADNLRRRSAMQTLAEMKAIEERGGDDVKAEDIKAIGEAIAGALRPQSDAPAQTMWMEMMREQNSFLREQLKMERDRADHLLTAKPATDPNTLLGLAAGVLPLVGKLPSKSLSGILSTVMRVLRPDEAPPAEQAGGWTPEQVMVALQTAGPLIQGILTPLIESIRAAVTGRPAPVETARDVTPRPPVQPVVPQPTPGGETLMPLQLTDEEKMSMDLFFQFLAEHDYESAWTTLGTTEKTAYANMAVMDLKETTASRSVFPLFMRLDSRAMGKRTEIEAYLEWAKTTKKPEIEKRLAEEEADDDPEPAA